MNQLLDNFLKGTMWIWLPIYAFFELLGEAKEKFWK